MGSFLKTSFIHVLFLCLFLPPVLAIGFSNPTPLNVSIEGNCENIPISIDILLLDNSTPFSDNAILPDFLGQKNVSGSIEGFNNTEGWYGNIQFIVPEHNGTRITSLIPWRTKKVIVPESIFTAFGGIVNGVCFITDVKEESQGNTTIHVNSSVVIWASCVDNGNYNITATSNLTYSEQEAVMFIEGLEYKTPDIVWDGFTLSSSFVVFDGDIVDVLVKIPFGEYNWTFEVHTNLSEPEPIIIEKEVIVVDDDDDRRGGHSGGGYVPLILNDKPKENATIFPPPVEEEETEEEEPIIQPVVEPEIIEEEPIEKKGFPWWIVIVAVVGIIVVIGCIVFFNSKAEGDVVG